MCDSIVANVQLLPLWLKAPNQNVPLCYLHLVTASRFYYIVQ